MAEAAVGATARRRRQRRQRGSSVAGKGGWQRKGVVRIVLTSAAAPRAEQRQRWKCGGSPAVAVAASALWLAVDACRAMKRHLATNDGTIVGGGLGTRGGLMAGGRDARRDNQPNERGATRGGGVMRGGGKAKAPDNVTECATTTNKWRGVKRGEGAS